MDGLTRDDSVLIGFVLACRFAGAIDDGELRKWAEYILLSGDEYPPYILDLVDFQGPLSHLFRVLGFAPSGGLRNLERKALHGIAYARGKQLWEEVVPQDVALAALRRCPGVVEMFRSTFPYLEFRIDSFQPKE